MLYRLVDIFSGDPFIWISQNTIATDVLAASTNSSNKNEERQNGGIRKVVNLRPVQATELDLSTPFIRDPLLSIK